MTYLDAAISILKASKKPMTSAEITQSAIRRALIHPSGKTPAATMSAILYLHVRDAAEPAFRWEGRPGPTRAARGSVRWMIHVTRH